MKNRNQSGKFSTSDLPTAAFLAAGGFEFLGTTESGARVAFEFGTTAEGKNPADGARDYLNNAPVPARTFADALAHFKNVLRDRRDFSSPPQTNKTNTGDFMHGRASRN